MVTDSSNTDWFVYHAWIGPITNINVYPPGRVLNIDKITWTAEQWPHIGHPSDTPRPEPTVANPVPAQSAPQGSFVNYTLLLVQYMAI